MNGFCCKCFLTSLLAPLFRVCAISFLVASSLAAQTVLRDGWKVQSSAQVSASGSQISETGFSTRGWYATSAPKTVFAVLVENGVDKNPYYGMNLRTFP